MEETIFRIGNFICYTADSLIERVSNEDEIQGEFYEKIWDGYWEKAGTFCFIRDKKESEGEE